MVLLSEFFKIWGDHFGDSNFGPELSIDERVYYQVRLMQRFMDYEDIKTCLFWAGDLNVTYEKDEWGIFIENAPHITY